MSRVWIVTGGCGFVGTNLTAALLLRGDRVIAVDSLTRNGAAENLSWLRQRAAGGDPTRFTFHHADIRSRTDVERVVRGADGKVFAIAHLAGQVAMTVSQTNPRYDFEVNALGALNVLEAARQFAPGAIIIYSSTNKVYGDLELLRYEELSTRWTLPDFPHGLDERTPLDFRTPYGCSKGAADQYFLEYHRLFGLRTTVLRHSSIYGGRQFATEQQGWVGWFCAEVLRQRREREAGDTVRPIRISGDGKQVRDLLHADDVARCYQLAAETEGANGRAFNIGGGPSNSLSLLELIEKLEKMIGIETAVEHGPVRASDQRVFVADNRAAESVLGWRPVVGEEEGLRRMLNWSEEITHDHSRR